MMKYFAILILCSFALSSNCFSQDKISVENLFKGAQPASAREQARPQPSLIKDGSPAQKPAAEPVKIKNQPSAQNATPAKRLDAQKSQPAAQPSQASVAAQNSSAKSVSAPALEPAPASPRQLSDEDFAKKMSELQNQRRKITFDIYKLRRKMIQDNPDLRVLQRTIIGLHEKMAKQLNNDPKAQNLMSKAGYIDKQMIDLINSQRKGQAK